MYTDRLLDAGARIDGMDPTAWRSMLLERGEVLHARAHAIAGYPDEITEAHAIAAEARADAAEAQREADRIAAEEAAAWAELAASRQATEAP